MRGQQQATCLYTVRTSKGRSVPHRLLFLEAKLFLAQVARHCMPHTMADEPRACLCCQCSPGRPCSSGTPSCRFNSVSKALAPLELPLGMDVQQVGPRADRRIKPVLTNHMYGYNFFVFQPNHAQLCKATLTLEGQSIQVNWSCFECVQSKAARQAALRRNSLGLTPRHHSSSIWTISCEQGMCMTVT